MHLSPAREYLLEQGLNIQDEKNRTAHVKIEGCGAGSRILVHLVQLARLAWPP